MTEATTTANLLFKRFRLRDEGGVTTTCRVVGMKPATDMLVLDIEGEEDYIFLSADDFQARLDQKLD